MWYKPGLGFRFRFGGSSCAAPSAALELRYHLWYQPALLHILASAAHLAAHVILKPCGAFVSASALAVYARPFGTQAAGPLVNS